MARKKKTVALSTEGINEFLTSIQMYGEELNEKTELFLELLLDMGQQVCENNALVVGDQDVAIPDFRFELEWQGDELIGKLIGEGSDITFIEFGSGYLYNGNLHSSPHPRGEGMGMTIGDYPGIYKDAFGYSQGAEYDGWYYKGTVHYGVKAGMPMYKAAQEIQARAREIAEKVFG